MAIVAPTNLYTFVAGRMSAYSRQIKITGNRNTVGFRLASKFIIILTVRRAYSYNIK